MSNAEPSPRPWQVRYGDRVADATGARVAACWRPENAALIVAAVNKHGMPIVELIKAYGALEAERDRLRDVMRKAVETLEQVYKHADMSDALREVVVETQREARAAIGKDASP